jgi:hypothetical protein
VRTGVLLLVLVGSVGAVAASCDERTPTPASGDAGSSLSSEPTPPQQAGYFELVHTSRALRTGCRQAARILGFSVPCPVRLPKTLESVVCGIPAEFSGAEITPKKGCAFGREFLLEPASLVLPPNYRGVDGEPVAHFLIEATRLDVPACAEVDAKQELTLRNSVASLVACSEHAHSLHQGHLVLQWREGGITYRLSIHGHTEVNRQLLMDVVGHLIMIPPRN